MRRDLMKRIVEASLPQTPDRPSGHAPRRTARDARKRSTTTILALRYNEGILCAGDRQVSGGWFRIVSTDMLKIHTVSPISAMLGSGSVSFIQQAERYLSQSCKQFSRQYGVHMSTEGQANLLSEWCSIRWSWYGGWFSFGAILAGLDPDGAFRLYSVEDDGCRIDEAQYAATGSGGDTATSVLDQRWEPDMELVPAMSVALDAQYHAGTRDMGTSDARIVLPILATITRSGVAFVEPKHVLAVLADVLSRKSNRPLHTALALGVSSFRKGR